MPKAKEIEKRASLCSATLTARRHYEQTGMCYLRNRAGTGDEGTHL